MISAAVRFTKPLSGILLGLLMAFTLYGAFHAANDEMTRAYVMVEMSGHLQDVGYEPDLKTTGFLVDLSLAGKDWPCRFPGFHPAHG